MNHHTGVHGKVIHHGDRIALFVIEADQIEVAVSGTADTKTIGSGLGSQFLFIAVDVQVAFAALDTNLCRLHGRLRLFYQNRQDLPEVSPVPVYFFRKRFAIPFFKNRVVSVDHAVVVGAGIEDLGFRDICRIRDQPADFISLRHAGHIQNNPHQACLTALQNDAAGIYVFTDLPAEDRRFSGHVILEVLNRKVFRARGDACLCRAGK